MNKKNPFFAFKYWIYYDYLRFYLVAAERDNLDKRRFRAER